MANYQDLKDAIKDDIKTNGNQEITGQIMQNTLLTMVNSLGKNYQYAGIATPDTNPGTPDENIFYIAIEPGQYVNFNNYEVDKYINIFKWNGSWIREKTDIPNNILVSSIGKILFDNMFVDNVSVVGSGEVLSYTTKNGYYNTRLEYTENARFTTKVFQLENNAYYVLKISICGEEPVANIVFFNENDIAIGAMRQEVINKIIKSSGAYKIGLISSAGSEEVTFKKYNSVNVDKIADLAVTESKIADLAVTESKISFGNTKNKFNPNDENVMLGYYQANSSPVQSATYNLTGYIPVKPTQKYVSSKDGVLASPRFVTFFDKDLVIQSSISLSYETTNVIQIPENSVYVRLSLFTLDWEDFQFEEGEEPTRYEPYKVLINKDVLPKVEIDNVVFSEYEYFGKNILSPDEIIKGGNHFIDTSNGKVSTSPFSAYGYTDYIPIDERGLVITGGNVAGEIIGHAVYDVNKQYIRGVRQKTVEYEPGDAYVRFSIANTEEIMIEQSLTATTPYEPYKGRKKVISSYVLPKIAIPEPTEELININLPDKIIAIVGDTLQLFYRGIIQAVNPYNYNIVVSCSKGKQYPRYWEYTPQLTDVGTTTLTITIKDENRNIINAKQCQLITKNVVKSPESKINVMCFGDSLTSAGIWCAEADRRLTGSGGVPEGKAFTNIEFVGSKKNGTTGYFGVGGWTWSHYTTKGLPAYRFEVSGISSLTIGVKYTNNGNTFTIMEVNVTDGSGNILCSVDSLTPAPEPTGVLTKVDGSGDATINYTSVAEDNRNPLWDNEANKMTFIPYANEVANGKIDVVYTLLTWNGLSAAKTDFSAIIEQVKVFADTLHSEFPNAKLKIMGVQIPSVRGGMGASYGATGTGYADWYGMVVTALNMNVAYQNFANEPGYSDFVEFVNVSSQFDTEYNMPHKDAPVNTRNEFTEWLDTNGVHPSNNGYYQIGDVVYRNFVSNYCQ